MSADQAPDAYELRKSGQVRRPSHGSCAWLRPRSCVNRRWLAGRSECLREQRRQLLVSQGVQELAEHVCVRCGDGAGTGLELRGLQKQRDQVTEGHPAGQQRRPAGAAALLYLAVLPGAGAPALADEADPLTVRWRRVQPCSRQRTPRNVSGLSVTRPS
jgi:hypothetical protein